MAGETLSFLIADDHPMVRDALASALGQAFAGAGIGMAGSLAQVQSALVARAGRLPDLVLADLHLDDVSENRSDGLEVVEALRRAWGRAVPAALVTADRDPTLRLRARARQVELLHKPVKPAALRALLRLSERITPAEAPVRVLR